MLPYTINHPQRLYCPLSIIFGGTLVFQNTAMIYFWWIEQPLHVLWSVVKFRCKISSQPLLIILERGSVALGLGLPWPDSPNLRTRLVNHACLSARPFHCAHALVISGVHVTNACARPSQPCSGLVMTCIVLLVWTLPPSPTGTKSHMTWSVLVVADARRWSAVAALPSCRSVWQCTPIDTLLHAHPYLLQASI